MGGVVSVGVGLRGVWFGRFAFGGLVTSRPIFFMASLVHSTITWRSGGVMPLQSMEALWVPQSMPRSLADVVIVVLMETR